MRLLLLSGPGGAGTTTITAATAAAAAARGLDVLTVGADPGLADVLGVPLGDRPRPVGPRWSAVQPDALARTEASWARLRPQLTALLGRRGPPLPAAEELLPPAGAGELAMLSALLGWAGSGEWDVVVVDAGAPAQALRLLESAGALRWYLSRLLPAHHRATMSGLLALPGRGDALSELVTGLDQALCSAEGLLAGPGVSVRAVAAPGTVAMAAVRRLAAAIAVHGLSLDGVVVNRLSPDSAGTLATVGEAVAGLPSWSVAEAPAEPLGATALRALGAQCYGEQDPVGLPGEPVASAVERDGERFVLDLPLPHVARAELGLTRCGDDLVLTVAGHRHHHPLRGVLTRCTVDGAELADGRLRVWFRPDPAQWPDAVPLPAAAAAP